MPSERWWELHFWHKGTCTVVLLRQSRWSSPLPKLGDREFALSFCSSWHNQQVLCHPQFSYHITGFKSHSMDSACKVTVLKLGEITSSSCGCNFLQGRVSGCNRQGVPYLFLRETEEREWRLLFILSLFLLAVYSGNKPKSFSVSCAEEWQGNGCPMVYYLHPHAILRIQDFLLNYPKY